MDYIIACLIGMALAALVLAILYSKNSKRIVALARLEEYTQGVEASYLPPELTAPLKERLGIWLMQFFTRVSGKMLPGNKKEVYSRKLQMAGDPWGINAETFLFFKYLFLFIMLLIGIWTANVLYFSVLFCLGYFMPDLCLKSKEKGRHEEILKSLPDVLDLLSVSVEAGLGFDAALQKVIDKSGGPLSDEFAKTLQEINIGKHRREALRDMAERVAVDDLTTFLASIIQAEQLGVSIANVLRLQSGQLRANRRMRAEEKAQQAPVKILIPLLLFIFPCILLVLLGPAVIQLIDTFN